MTFKKRYSTVALIYNYKYTMLKTKASRQGYNLGSESYRSRVMPYFDIIRHLYLLSYNIKLNYSYRFINKKFNNRS